MRERRVTGAAVQRIAAGLSERDRAIVSDVARVRVLTGQMVGRLYFTGLAGRHADRTRRRVLERLVDLQLLSTLERRIGGVRAGSAGLVYALGPGGQRLVALDGHDLGERARQPGTPTDRFLLHNLAVAELYVGLAETVRAGALLLVDFRNEPAAWWRDCEGEWIKPDAYAVVSAGDIEDHWAIEVDNATESLPTLRRKLKTYLDLAMNGERGPGGAPLPRVLVTVPDERRAGMVGELVRGLPEPAAQLFAVTIHGRAVSVILAKLRE